MNISKNVLHRLLRLGGDDFFSGGVIAVLGGITNRIAHVGKTALVDKINDELHFMDALKVRHLWLVPCFNEGIKARFHQRGNSPTENRLFAKEIGLCFLFKACLKDSCSPSPKTFGVGKGNVFGVATGVLVDCD